MSFKRDEKKEEIKPAMENWDKAQIIDYTGIVIDKFIL